MLLIRIFMLILFINTSLCVSAQLDSAIERLEALQQIPVKYINNIDSKIDKYSSRITSKTEKTLAKLAKWEKKIEAILNKVNPEAAQRLFGNDQSTFGNILDKIKQGKTIAENYKAQYDQYRDKLTTSIKYLQQQKDNLNNKLVKPIEQANKKLTALEEEVRTTESVQQFIKERRKLLMEEAVKYIGNSRYLTKINKEAYYYVETLKNYKEIFSDPAKAEETALSLLNRIPAFQQFVQQNSLLSSLFRSPSASVDMSSYTGLQTRASVTALVQERIAQGGPNIRDYINQNFQDAEGQLSQLKDKVLKGGGSSSDAETPDFKPNMQKTRTFKQRLVYGSNLQFGKANSLLPGTADIGLSIGYKLNDKSIVGLGASYKLGMGTLSRIRLSTEGISLRSFIDWKLKKQFFISGGYEMNYLSRLSATTGVANQQTALNSWQSSGLLGLTKKLNVKTKFFKASSIQLLYDFLYRQHRPASQPVLFRVGYSFR